MAGAAWEGPPPTPSAGDRSAATKASSQPSTSTTTGRPPHSSERSVSITTAEAASYAGASTGRKIASGSLRAASRSGMPEPTPYSRASYDAVETTPRSVGSPRPPTTTGSPASSGRRSTSTAAMNWSRSTCRTHLCSATSGLTSSGAGPHRGGGSASVDSIWSMPGEQQQVDHDRAQLRQDRLRGEHLACARPGRSPRRPRAARAGPRPPSGRRGARRPPASAAAASSTASPAYDARHRPPVVGGHRDLPDQHPGAAQRPVERVDQLRHPPQVAAVPDPERRRRHHRHPLVGRRPAARGSGSRWSGRRRAGPAPCSTSPSTITSAAARSSSAILRTTCAACSRGRRSGAAGTTVARHQRHRAADQGIGPAGQRLARAPAPAR